MTLRLAAGTAPSSVLSVSIAPVAMEAVRPADCILFTIHGSHLYGLAHENSDRDFFSVVSRGTKTEHKIVGDIDTTEVPLDVFLRNVYSGSHQSCEALFSPEAWVHPQWEPMFRGVRVAGEEVFRKYRRTIKKFAYGTPKQKRHAMRLGYNLADLRDYGRFNPVMTPGQITTATAVSELYWGKSLVDIAINL